MNFRSLSKNDSCLIAQLFSQSFSDGWTKEMLVSGFETGGLKAIGAFDGEQMVGVITYSIGVDFADIEDVVVQKTFYMTKVLLNLKKLTHLLFLLGILRRVGLVKHLLCARLQIILMHLWLCVGIKKVKKMVMLVTKR